MIVSVTDFEDGYFKLNFTTFNTKVVEDIIANCEIILLKLFNEIDMQKIKDYYNIGTPLPLDLQNIIALTKEALKPFVFLEYNRYLRAVSTINGMNTQDTSVGQRANDNIHLSAMYNLYARRYNEIIKDVYFENECKTPLKFASII